MTIPFGNTRWHFSTLWPIGILRLAACDLEVLTDGKISGADLIGCQLDKRPWPRWEGLGKKAF